MHGALSTLNGYCCRHDCEVVRLPPCDTFRANASIVAKGDYLRWSKCESRIPVSICSDANSGYCSTSFLVRIGACPGDLIARRISSCHWLYPAALVVIELHVR